MMREDDRARVLIFTMGMLWGALMAITLLYSTKVHGANWHREATDRTHRGYYPWLGDRREQPGPAASAYVRGLSRVVGALGHSFFPGQRGQRELISRGESIHTYQVQVVRHQVTDVTSVHLVLTDNLDRPFQFRASYGRDHGQFEAQLSQGSDEIAPFHGALMMSSHPWDGERFAMQPAFDYQATAISQIRMLPTHQLGRGTWIEQVRKCPSFRTSATHPVVTALSHLTDSSPLDLGVPMLNGIFSVLLYGEQYTGDFVR